MKSTKAIQLNTSREKHLLQMNLTPSKYPIDASSLASSSSLISMEDPPILTAPRLSVPSWDFDRPFPRLSLPLGAFGSFELDFEEEEDTSESDEEDDEESVEDGEDGSIEENIIPPEDLAESLQLSDILDPEKEFFQEEPVSADFARLLEKSRNTLRTTKDIADDPYAAHQHNAENELTAKSHLYALASRMLYTVIQAYGDDNESKNLVEATPEEYLTAAFCGFTEEQKKQRPSKSK
jgi:hypothetical protein